VAMSPEEFQTIYPRLMQWISATLAAHAAQARPVTAFGFARLPRYYRGETLVSAKVVIVDRLPVPPLTAMGLHQYAEMERMPIGGITYLDTYFLTRAESPDESLHFHELIHVVQWRILGPEAFLARYADGLDRFGYRKNPLEVMAYDAQERFDAGEVFDAERYVAKALEG
jgi:hypothetical protein